MTPPQLPEAAAQREDFERHLAAARAEAARAAGERDDLQKRLFWWQADLEQFPLPHYPLRIPI